MVEALNSVTREMALAALDASMVRHRAIAANIANHASVDFSALAVDFERYMAPLRNAVLEGADTETLKARLQEVRASQIPVDELSDPVELDQEVGALMKNTMQYQAILTAIGNLGSLNKTVISGGNR